jgi:tetratricopeptide (TPR) repeat protein
MTDPVYPITSAQEFIRQAHAAFAGGDLQNTRQCLRAALAFQPEDAPLLLALGHVEFGLGLYELALERYVVVCEMESSLPEALSGRALTLQLLNRPIEAQAVARRALNLEPDNLVALKVLARVCLDQRRDGEARHWCRRILQQNPTDPEGLRLLDQCRFELDEFQAEPGFTSASDGVRSGGRQCGKTIPMAFENGADSGRPLSLSSPAVHPVP